MDTRRSMKNFFMYLGIGFVISSIKISLIGVSLIEIIKLSSITNIFNLYVNLPQALFFMILVDIYSEVKKNIKNERCRNLYRIYIWSLLFKI